LEKIRDKLLNLVKNKIIDYKAYSNLIERIYLSDYLLKQAEIEKAIILSISLEPKFYGSKL